MTIHPTGTCFDDVLDHQTYLRTEDPTSCFRQHIVHGIVLFPEDQPDAGEPYAHAWVEDDVEGRVYQSGFVNGQKVWWSAPKAEWEARMRPQSRTRYTYAEALALNWRSGYYGPWKPEYLELCKERKQRARAIKCNKEQTHVADQESPAGG